MTREASVEKLSGVVYLAPNPLIDVNHPCPDFLVDHIHPIAEGISVYASAALKCLYDRGKMSKLSRIVKLPLKFFTDVGEVLNAPSYYPECPRKSWLRRALEISISRVDGDWNPSYNKFGQDVCGGYWKGDKACFVYETTFWRKVIKQNYHGEVAANYSVIMRDKCLFWQFMKSYGLPTPEIYAHSKRGHFFLGLREVDFKTWIEAWGSFDGPLFLKDDTNCCGRGVYKLAVTDGVVVPPEGVVLDHAFFAKKDFILQAAIRNHPELDRLYTKSLNTARFITVWDDERNEPVLFTQFFRCGANGNSVDNWAVGGLLFHLDERGMIGEDGFFKKACFSPNNAMRVKSHPESGCVFKGLKLPDYEKGLELCLRAHALLPRLKSIGWDVAFTTQGPVLIEGNDDWEISPAQMVNGGLAVETKRYFGV